MSVVFLKGAFFLLLEGEKGRGGSGRKSEKLARGDMHYYIPHLKRYQH